MVITEGQRQQLLTRTFSEIPGIAANEMRAKKAKGNGDRKTKAELNRTSRSDQGAMNS